MNLSPIGLFVYNRPRHTQRTIEALQRNEYAKESELFIFSDGAKQESDKKKVSAVRTYISSLKGFKSITIIERENNFGLSKSIITGITQIVNERGSIIVLEDDLVTSTYFLRYMNEGLEFYKNEEKVIGIHGYMYPHDAKLPETFFLKGADCWGWATWKRGWNLFEENGSKLLSELADRRLTKEFNFNNNCNYIKLLKDQIAGKNNSWAIRWHASSFLKGRFTLYPALSLVDNIGNDYSGTHYGSSLIYRTKIADKPITIKPIPLEENKIAREEIENFFKKYRLNLYGRVKSNFLKLYHLIKARGLRTKYPAVDSA